MSLLKRFVNSRVATTATCRPFPQPTIRSICNCQNRRISYFLLSKTSSFNLTKSILTKSSLTKSQTNLRANNLPIIHKRNFSQTNQKIKEKEEKEPEKEKEMHELLSPSNFKILDYFCALMIGIFEFVVFIGPYLLTVASFILVAPFIIVLAGWFFFLFYYANKIIIEFMKCFKKEKKENTGGIDYPYA